jgi:glucokinase
MRYGFGVDLGGTTVKLGFFSENGELIEKWEIPTRVEQSGQQILPDIAASIFDFLQKKEIAEQEIIGIGIGVPGPVRPDGTVNRCINLGWSVFNIEKELEMLTGFPVKAGNDATVAALGECWKGGGAGCSSMVFATLGTGVGGGIVVNGNVIHGTHGAGGEIGHMVLNRNEPALCSCGKRGCVEQYCSATGIVRLAKQHLSQTQAPSSLRSYDPLTCKDVFDAAADGDATAQEILEQVYAYMGEFLANICNIVDPEAVVLGGGVSKAGKPLLDGVQRHFDNYVFHAVHPVRFALATLGNDAGAYGAFKLILDKRGE